MNPLLTPPMLEHLLGEEIPTKHKEVMRQLFKFAKSACCNSKGIIS